MSLIWRFYSDPERHWHWQLLAFDSTVLEASDRGYEDYEGCVGNAEQHGYRFSPAKSTRPAPARKLTFARRYAKVQSLRKEGAAVTGGDEPASAPRD